MMDYSTALELRAMRSQDAPLMLEWENDPEVRAVSGNGQIYTLDQIEEFIDRGNSLDIETQGQIRLIIEYCGKAIGTADLFEHCATDSSAKVGILIYPMDLRGQGLATRAINLLIQFATRELKLELLTAQCHRANRPSVRLFERCGFMQTQSPDAELIEFNLQLQNIW